MKEIKIKSRIRNELIDVTNDVEKIVEKKDIKRGYVVLYVPHTTAGITINEGADPSVQRDIIETLDRLIPKEGNYHHLEGNSDAHIKSSLFGPSLSLIISEGRLVLGTWQSIYFCEFDGPRRRRMLIKIMEG